MWQQKNSDAQPINRADLAHKAARSRSFQTLWVSCSITHLPIGGIRHNTVVRQHPHFPRLPEVELFDLRGQWPFTHKNGSDYWRYFVRTNDDAHQAVVRSGQTPMISFRPSMMWARSSVSIRGIRSFVIISLLQYSTKSTEQNANRPRITDQPIDKG